MNYRPLILLLGILLLSWSPRSIAAGDSVVVVNEVHYNPTNLALEYVEIHNQLWVNVDLSGWRFDGGITYEFAEGTVIPARGYMVVAKDPVALQTATGFAGAKGPFVGTLSNDGETLKLWNNNRALRTRPVPPPPPAANQLWSVDIQGDGVNAAGGQPAPTTFSGAEPVAGFGNVWNSFLVASYTGLASPSGTSTNPALANLKNSAGTTTTVGFDMTGMVSGFNNAVGAAGSNALNADYLFLAAGNAGSSITWKLTGIPTGQTYSMYFYGSAIRSVRIKVDVDGNGSTLNDAYQTVPAGGALLVNGIIPTGTGRINGLADTPGGEVNWSGFQVFVPSTGGGGGAPDLGSYSPDLSRRRLMDEFSYGDSGKWPVAPDGSGFTLAKIDSQGGGQSANWAWSLALNGTPGAQNFPAGAAWNSTLPTVAFNEVSGATDTVWQCELYNHGASPLTLTGWTLVNGDTTATYTFPATTLAAGAYLTLSETTLGFRPLDNARLFLRTPTQLVDAVKVATTPRARQTVGTGRWLRPNAATFGSANTFALQTGVVINEIFYHAFDESPEQWVELKNRTGAPIDISGWKFTDGIGFTFPPGTSIGAGQFLVVASDAATLLAKYPGRPIAGTFTGSLGDGDSLTLEDALGNPADEVSYEEGGRWPEFAAGGGASLELRDADADNAVPESWSPSNTAPLGSWQTVTYDFVATDDGQGNDAFNEFLLGFLDNGEILLDDVSVRENPTSTNIEFIQNGTFQSDTVGGAPLKWRLTGTHGLHGRSVVVTDPDNASNKCLKIVCTGHTDDKHNKAETTFNSGRTVVLGRTYRVSFKAKWLAGSNQINTRLYFNYGQRTTLLSVGNQWGTPGIENSTAVANAGPTASAVTHSPVVPANGAATTVSALLSDPEGIASASLFYRVGSGAWQSVAMTLGANGRHSGTIPGQTTGSLVQFYISANDTLSANAKWPAAGDRGGAFYRVNDGNADASGIRGNFRVLIRPEDESALLLNVNRMGNHPFPGTVIHDERVVYYNCDVSLKGSASSRPSAAGISIGFPPDQPFRGVHTNVSVENVGNMKEIITKHILNRAGGGYWSDFNDVAKVMGPGLNQIGLVAQTRTTGVFLKSLFPDESNGILYNHELLYQPNGTVDGNPESLKLNNPYNHTRGFLGFADRGLDKEQYRWAFQLRNKRKADDYAPIVRLNRAFVLTGQPFIDEILATIDIDQWMRTWALMGLYGNDDQYGRLWPHNWRIYQRPTDGRLIALPWDLDRSFLLGTSASLTPTTDINGTYQLIQNLFLNVEWKRTFDSHILDLVNTTYNSTYMTQWVDHLATVTGESTAAGGDFAGVASYIASRANYALSTLPASVPFAITTNGGADFTTAANTVTLTGSGWSDVYTITRTGQPQPLVLSWTGATTWTTTIPLVAGANVISLAAFDQHGTAAGTDTITITSNTTNIAASSANIVISEVHYHPADPSGAEFTAGYTDADDFQFIELHNISVSAVELAGSSFSQGLTFNFTTSTVLPAGGTFVLARNAAAFSMRYGFAPGGTFVDGRLSHADETITLLNATSAVIKTFRYEDNNPWPASADGPGYSLQIIRPKTNPDAALPQNWTSSAAIGGSPGTVEDVTFTAWLATFPALTLTGPLDDEDRDGLNNALEYAMRTNPLIPNTAATSAAIQPITVLGVTSNYFTHTFRRHIGATSATWTPQFSPDLGTWQAADLVLYGSVNNGDGTESVIYRTVSPLTTTKGFGRLSALVE